MTTIDVTQKLLDLDGKPMMDGTPDDAVEATLRTVLRLALINFRPSRQGETLGIDDQGRRYDLAKKITKNDEVELKAEDVVFLKNCVASWFQNPAVYGVVVDLIDPAKE